MDDLDSLFFSHPRCDKSCLSINGFLLTNDKGLIFYKFEKRNIYILEIISVNVKTACIYTTYPYLFYRTDCL
jgi:hypothetical protein